MLFFFYQIGLEWGQLISFVPYIALHPANTAVRHPKSSSREQLDLGFD